MAFPHLSALILLHRPTIEEVTAEWEAKGGPHNNIAVTRLTLMQMAASADAALRQGRHPGLLSCYQDTLSYALDWLDEDLPEYY